MAFLLYILVPVCAGIINNASQSLFTYDGNTFEEFFDPGFTPAFEPVFDDPALEFTATEICGGDVFCLFDIAATEDIDIGQETLISGQEFDSIVNVSQPCEYLVWLYMQT